MNIRKTKFDDHVLYNHKSNRLVLFKWDYAVNGVSRWFWTDGQLYGYIKGKKQLPGNCVLIDRLPERTL